MPSKPSKPYYQHDCDKCRFVGHTFDTEDIYVCERKDGDHELIVRYGNGPAMYSSTMLSIAARNLSLYRSYDHGDEPLGFVNDGKVYCRKCATNRDQAEWQDDSECFACGRNLLAVVQDMHFEDEFGRPPLTDNQGTEV